MPDSDAYIAPGSTRSLTRKTVIVTGVTKIQCCPYPVVDDELDYICKMAVQYINNWSNRNPFGVASWLHLAIARCLPFEDGNGQLARLLASIPLIREKYPPVYIAMYQKAEYYHAIRAASDGDHKIFVKCLVDGMREAINSLSTST
ncbi:hypothetical protein BYT27DRAFT_7125328 [Phlegmacium glaucopus]|nr:hypothetical protein BYT27DRAFT_7125328 [Phlegmacium glaucopus]